MRPRLASVPCVRTRDRLEATTTAAQRADSHLMRFAKLYSQPGERSPGQARRRRTHPRPRPSPGPVPAPPRVARIRTSSACWGARHATQVRTGTVRYSSSSLPSAGSSLPSANRASVGCLRQAHRRPRPRHTRRRSPPQQLPRRPQRSSPPSTASSLPSAASVAAFGEGRFRLGLLHRHVVGLRNRRAAIGRLPEVLAVSGSCTQRPSAHSTLSP